MQTKLGVLCDRIIEAGWLTTVIVTSLFFNFYSCRIFEPAKVTLLRSIALVMLLASAIRVFEAGFQGATSREKPPVSDLWSLVSRTPLVLATLFLAGVYVLTTITSVAPRLSLWGSYTRRQGTYTVLSYIVIFFMTWCFLRTRQQLERLITVILLTSLPISLYGILQHWGLDPLGWAADFAGRVFATMGNPIPLAAYLIMVVPLTMAALIESFSSAVHKKGKKPFRYILPGCYLFLLLVQLLCILFTQSRGPFLGLLAGLFFFLFLPTVFKRQRRMALILIGVAIVLGLFLVVLNLPHTPFPAVKKTPYIGRLLDLASVTARERILIWEGATEMITADPLRTIVGYGPETMYVAFNPYLQPELADMFGPGKTADRSHNEIWDTLVTTGLIGLIGYLFLVGTLFYWGLKWLGFIRGPRQRMAFILLWLMGGTLGTLAPWLLEGKWRFAGIGLPMGIVLTIGIYLMIHMFWEDGGNLRAMDNRRQSLFIALLSALIAHFVEIQFGIAVAATRITFWVYAALLVIMGCSSEREASAQAPVMALPTAASGRRRRRRKRPKRVTGLPAATISSLWDRSILVDSLLVGLILITTSFDLITTQSAFKARGFAIAGLIAVVWVFCGAVVMARGSEGERSAPGGKEISSLVTYSLVTFGSFVVFTTINIATTRPGADFSNTVVLYYLSLFLAMVAIAVALMRGVAIPPAFWRGARAWFYPLLGLGVAAFIFVTNFSLAKADVYCRVGSTYETLGHYDGGIAMYRRAVKLAPSEDRYYLLLGLACLAKGNLTSDLEQKIAWFAESQGALERAREINPLDSNPTANLGHLYRYWGEATTNPAERAGKLEKALEYYQQAMAMSPSNYGRHLKANMLQTQLSLGATYTAMGELDQAITIYKQASQMSPDDYVSHRSLAVMYQQLGRIKEALAEAKRALGLAPEEEKEAIQALIRELESALR